MSYFAQIDPNTAVNATTSILEGRSESLIILVLVILVFGFWLWKIHLPRVESEKRLREADKEIQKTNTQTLAEISKVTASIHGTTHHSSNTLSAMLTVKKIEVDCIEAVSQNSGIDLTKQLSEIRGVLKAVESGATS